MYKKENNDLNEQQLHSVILNILESAKKVKAKSVSIPILSAAIFGFKNERAIEIILDSCVNWLALNSDKGTMNKIRLCNYNAEIEKILQDSIIRKY